VCVFEHHVLSDQACNNDSVASAVQWIPKALQITPADHLLLEQKRLSTGWLHGAHAQLLWGNDCDSDGAQKNSSDKKEIFCNLQKAVEGPSCKQ
jgi:hypothetical protein